jgi:hypothetical protein
MATVLSKIYAVGSTIGFKRDEGYKPLDIIVFYKNWGLQKIVGSWTKKSTTVH